MKAWHAEARRLREENPLWTYDALAAHFGVNRGYMWKIFHPERAYEMWKRWRLRHPEKHRATVDRYRAKHRTRVLAREKILRAANAEAKATGQTKEQVLQQWGAA